MLSRSYIMALSVILAGSVLAGEQLLTLLCVLAVLPMLLAQLWRRWALSALSFERSLSELRVFPGAEIEMRTRIVNRKPLPLSRLTVQDMVPAEGIEIVGRRLESSGKPGRKVLPQVLSLNWYEAVTHHYRLRCPQRGAYRFGPVALRAGDPFGFFSQEGERPAEERLLVYPSLIPAPQLGFAMQHLLGDVRSKARLIVDPMRTIGVRDYHRDDPLKNIHWNATARRGALQTKIYEPVTALEVWCFLDINTFPYAYEGVDREKAERMISMAATLCTALLKAGHAVGFWTNAAVADQGANVRVPASRSPQQGMRLLEALAPLTPYAGPTIDRLLRLAQPGLPIGATALLVSAIDTPAIRAALLRLRAARHPVIWVALGRDKPSLPGATIYHAPPTHQ